MSTPILGSGPSFLEMATSRTFLREMESREADFSWDASELRYRPGSFPRWIEIRDPEGQPLPLREPTEDSFDLRARDEMGSCYYERRRDGLVAIIFND